MASGSPLSSPKAPPSPSLEPPRKSVELEDSGTKDVEESSDEQDVFSDARDELASPRAPAVPLTRVERVDDEAAHGEEPGTEAYEKRAQDAVPDEVAVIPDGKPSEASSRRESQTVSPERNSVPRTVVEKIDPDSPSFGEVPGTSAHVKRRADAVPDSIVKSGSPSPEPGHRSTASVESIPKTVVTRVDSEPSHGEVPGTEAYKKRMQDAQPDIIEKDEGRQIDRRRLMRHDANKLSSRSKFFSPLSAGFKRDMKSPIAADGGFGPMTFDGSDDSEVEKSPMSPKFSLKSPPVPDYSATHNTNEEDEDDEKEEEEEEEEEKEEEPGDDFDDFEEGAEGEDFGDFDEAEDQSESSEPSPVAVPITVPPFDIPDLSDPSYSSINTSIASHLDTLFPATAKELPNDLPGLPESSSLFLSERSHSLWSQLVAPPPLQPPNWVRSRIRRLFLVSLGVPVDLDEILPASKQKKLVLQYTSPEGAKDPAAARVKAEADAASDSAASASKGGKTKRRKGPPPPPEFDIVAAKALCATTKEAIDGMSDDELRAHVKKLDELILKGREVMQYWVSRKDAAVAEKEAFDGVIENLVQHARRTRK